MLAEEVLERLDALFGGFKTECGWCAEADRQLARVDLREKFPSDVRRNRDGRGGDGKDGEAGLCGVREAGCEGFGVESGQGGKYDFEPRSVLGMALGQKPRAHHGNESAREEERREHREGHGDGERTEQKPADARQEGQRRENEDRGAGRHEDWKDHLAATVERRFDAGFSHEVVPVVVLEFHDGIIHQRPDGQGEPAEGHDVQRVSCPKKTGHRSEECEGDGESRDQGHAQISEKSENHQRDEHRAEQTLEDERLEGLNHGNGLIHDKAERGARWQAFLH